jgi:ribosomal protein L24
MFRLLTNLAFGIYKTKWTYHLPRRKPGRQLQKPFKNWTIVRGDIVQMRSGDDKGKVGKVVKVLRKLNRVVVKGANVQEYTKSTHKSHYRTRGTQLARKESIISARVQRWTVRRLSQEGSSR